jgi:hypothetical protein
MKLTGSRCQCGACKLLFSRTSVFDKHRIGSFGKMPPQRRCLTEAELQERGFVCRGGVWGWPDPKSPISRSRSRQESISDESR